MAAVGNVQFYQRQAIENFVAALPLDAPISQIVKSQEVQAKLSAFEEADARANLAQSRHRIWGRRGIRATTFGILIGALLLFPIDAQIEGLPRLAVGLLQTMALAATFGATALLAWLKPAEEWMSSRAEAERLRGQIFAATLAQPAPAGTDPKDVLSQKLSLLLSAHLEDQLRYFDRSAKMHKGLSSTFSPLRIFGYVLIVGASVLGFAALTNAVGVPLPEHVQALVNWLVLPDVNRWQLGITTIASGILAHATARTLMDEDERKAVLYAVTADKLRGLITRNLPTLRSAIASGDDAPLGKFFVNARSILDQEHAVWSFMRLTDDAADEAS